MLDLLASNASSYARFDLSIIVITVFREMLHLIADSLLYHLTLFRSWFFSSTPEFVSDRWYDVCVLVQVQHMSREQHSEWPRLPNVLF